MQIIALPARANTLWQGYTPKNLTSCSKFANKLSTSCARTACPSQQVWNNLLTTCNKLDGIIRLVARFSQQARYNNIL